MREPFLIIFGLFITGSAVVLFLWRHYLARIGAQSFSWLPSESKLRSVPFQTMLCTISFSVLGAVGVIVALVFGVGIG
jgi:hypothetical protein